MKIMSITKILLTFALAGSVTWNGNAVNPEKVHIELNSSPWSFNTSLPAQSKLTIQSPKNVLSKPSDISKGFTIKFVVDLKKFDSEKVLLEIPWILNVSLRQHDTKDHTRQNYPAYKMPDGTVPVLEASLALVSPGDNTIKQDMTIGIPLAMLDKPEGEHEVILNFTGVRWTMYVDGELLDNDFPFGYPQADKIKSWELNPEYIKNAEISFPAIQPEKVTLQTPRTSPEIQYWTPQWHNAWVGDVVTFYHNDRYHVFYLFDRRGHASKFGRGSHYFEHLSTKDFKTWVEHDAATPIEEQWETFGTGTPFVYDNKVCISYGLHTTRLYPKEKTSLSAQWDYLEKNGHSGKFNFDMKEGIPAGSTYSISEDGISKFKKTGILFHPCENPSIYTDPYGKLKMLANYGAKGTWASDSVNGGWHCLDPNFPLGGDCTFFFRWGKYDYILGGFTRLWSKEADAPESAYKDIVSEGLDFYNGLSVPAVTEIPGNRFLLAGWMWMRAWGGPLVIHELIQYPDGRIGTKWMNEIIPETDKPKIIAKNITTTTTLPAENKSFMLTFDVQPTEAKSGKLGITLLPDNGNQNACELQICPGDKRAQFSTGSTDGFASEEKSLRQGGAPQQARNYAIENLIDVDKTFTVRLIVKGTDKLGGSLIDAEIAGQRTMISYRPDLSVEKMLFRTEGVKLKNVKIAALKN